MPLMQVKLVEKALMSNERMGIANAELTNKIVSLEEKNIAPSDWADDEDVLSDEWEMGVSAMTIDAVRALVAGKLKTLEET